MSVALLFIDIETLGVTPDSAIWEVAAARVEDGRIQGTMSTFVKHNPDAIDPDLPPSFQVDYRKRYDPETAQPPRKVLDTITRYAEGRAIVCGSNPGFDTRMLEALAGAHGVPPPPWHYHPIDVPTLVHGYLLGRGINPTPPWKSDFLSRIIGVDPDQFDRHTAMGDVEWVMAQWDAVMGGAAR